MANSKGCSSPILVTVADPGDCPPNSHSPSFFMGRAPSYSRVWKCWKFTLSLPQNHGWEMWFSPASGTQGKSARVFWEIFSSLIKDTCTREPPFHSCLRSYHVRSWGLELCTHLVTTRGMSARQHWAAEFISRELPSSGVLVMWDDYKSSLFKPLLIRSSQTCNQRQLKKCYFLQLLFKKAG